jgi:tetratricopeptide (TPR) repeat protein
MDLGDIDQAMDAYQQALRIARQTGDRRNEAAWLSSVGQAHSRLGDSGQAMSYHEQAISIYEQVGDRRGQGNELANLGRLAEAQGDPDRAHEAYLGALHNLEALKDPSAGQVFDRLAELEGQTV